MGIQINGNTMLNGKVDSDKKINKIKIGNSLVWEYKAPRFVYIYCSEGARIWKYNFNNHLLESSSGIIDSNLTRIALDNDFIYTASFSQYFRKIRKSNYSQVLFRQWFSYPRKIILDNDDLYMSDNSYVYKFTKTNFTDFTNFSYSESSILDFTLDEGFIYSSDRAGSYTYIRKIDKSTGAQSATSSGIYNSNFITIESDLNYIYASTGSTTWKILKSDMSTSSSTVGFNWIRLDGDELYGVSNSTLYKKDKTTLTNIHTASGAFLVERGAFDIYEDKIFVGMANKTVNVYSKYDLSLLDTISVGYTVSDIKIGT